MILHKARICPLLYITTTIITDNHSNINNMFTNSGYNKTENESNKKEVNQIKVHLIIFTV